MTAVIDEFEADIEVRGPALWVLPAGDLDIAGAPELQEAMRLALASDATSIVVDLRGIELLDSTGLRALLEARAEEGGERVSFVPGNEHVQGVLRIAGLLDALPFVEP
ncbi:MAG: anti-sigma factor antagonist [Solirubrobacterales bacterium]|nr:anti-sigma factor antagonist [Solirubrobacterales bacterium]